MVAPCKLPKHVWLSYIMVHLIFCGLSNLLTGTGSVIIQNNTTTYLKNIDRYLYFAHNIVKCGPWGV